MMMLTLLLLLVQEKPEFDKEKTKLYVYDGSRKSTLRVDRDGKVELTVPDTDPESARASKTYKAESAGEFRRKYPDVARRYELDRYLAPRTLPQADFEQWWEELKRNRDLIPELPDLQPGRLRDLLEEQRKMLEEFRKRFEGEDPGPAPGPVPPKPAPKPGEGGKEFGIKVETVSETLRDQLSLKEDEGVSVADVKAGTLAEKSGLLKHDIILKIGGKAVTDKWQFRSDVMDAMEKGAFELEIIRGGKRQTVKTKE